MTVIMDAIRQHNAQRMLTLREDVLAKVSQPPEIALERARCYTRVFAAQEGYSYIVKKALAF